MRWLRGTLVPGVACFVAGAAAYGQILHATGSLPSFEVTTVKPWSPAASPPPQRVDGTNVPRKVMKMAPINAGGQATDRVHFIGQMKIFIAMAYNLPVASESRIVGGPDWVNRESDRYEIEAKIDDVSYATLEKGTPAQQQEQVALMEQALLRDRFKLKVHFETREMPVYALVVAKGGAKLTPAREGETSKLFTLDSEQGSEITARAVTLEEFVQSPLMRTDGRLILDQTGLKGRYDFQLKSGSEQVAGTGGGEDDAPSIFTAIQEQLGLRLVRAKGPVEVIVIDHIERPSAN